MANLKNVTADTDTKAMHHRLVKLFGVDTPMSVCFIDRFDREGRMEYMSRPAWEIEETLTKAKFPSWFVIFCKGYPIFAKVEEGDLFQTKEGWVAQYATPITYRAKAVYVTGCRHGYIYRVRDEDIEKFGGKFVVKFRYWKNKEEGTVNEYLPLPYWD